MPDLQRKNKANLKGKTSRIHVRICEQYKKHLNSQNISESDYVRFLIQKDIEKTKRMEK